MKKHVLALPCLPCDQHRTEAAGQRALDVRATLVGNSKWVGSDGHPVAVSYETATGAAGKAIATNILGRIDDLMTYLDRVFDVKGKGGNVVICSSPFQGATDGSGGAYHYSCSFNSDSPGGSDWYECLATGNPDMDFGLVMAEVCESYMGLQRKGWNCGGSGGEGLSRFLAEIVSGGPNGALSAFASGSAWDGTDWISHDQGTDQDYPSIGCAILYCWWLTSLGYTVDQIVQAGEPDGTLASNYVVLAGKPSAQAFADFKAAVAAAGGPTSDNPFGVATPPYPGGPVKPPDPTPTGTLAPGAYTLSKGTYTLTVS